MHGLPETAGTAPASPPASPASVEAWNCLARRISLRLALVHWLRGFWSSLPWMSVAAAVVACLLGWVGIGIGLRLLAVLAIFGAAGIGLLAWSIGRRPGPARALAEWDRAAKRHACMVSAWGFSRRNSGSAGEGLHLRRASALLPEALRGLSAALPFPRPGWRTLWLMAAAAGVVLPASRAVNPGPDDRLLGKDAVAAAHAEGERLEQAAEILNAIAQKDDPVTEEIRREAEQELAGAADALREAEGKTAGGLLAQLAARADALEDLARSLSDDTGWLSDAVIAELRRHVDTADLADAIEAKAASPAADESDGLATGLDAAAGNGEEGLPARLGDALRNSLAQAEAEDRERPVGQHLFSASGKLDAARVREAAGEFRALADTFRKLAKRLEGRQRMEELAESVRGAGSAAAGSDGAVGPLQDTGDPMLGSESTGASGAGQGSAQENADTGVAAAPMLGEGQDARPVPVGRIGPDTGESDPIEGEPEGIALGETGEDGELGGPPDGILLAPVPGAAVAAGSGVTAGSSTNPPAEEAGTPATSEAARTAVVETEETGEGGSETRKVESGSRFDPESPVVSEPVGRKFLAVEEAALDDLPVPAGRRDEIRLYFEELKRRLDAGGD